MSSVELAVIVSTFERPGHLERCLESIRVQRGHCCALELIVTDDGSTDGTAELVRDFAGRADFPVRFVTHPHEGFRLARCRNRGVLASRAPYLVFTDGDCVLPPTHLAEHLRMRRPGSAVVGGCLRLSQASSERITVAEITAGAYLPAIPFTERWRMLPKALRAAAYSWLRCRMLPRLSGCDFAVWRADYYAINGHDENFVGWGLEDRDLQLRLSRLGVRFRSLLHRSAVSHLWHPPHPSFVRNNLGTENLAYFERPDRPTVCTRGLCEPEEGWLRGHAGQDPAVADRAPAALEGRAAA